VTAVIIISLALLDPAGVALRDKQSFTVAEFGQEIKSAAASLGTTDTPQNIREAVSSAARNVNRNLLSHGESSTARSVWMEFADKWSLFLIGGLGCVAVATKKVCELVPPSRVVALAARVECVYFSVLALTAHSAGSAVFQRLRENLGELFELAQLSLILRSPLLLFALYQSMQNCAEQTERGVYVLSIFLHVASTYDYILAVISPLARGEAIRLDVMMALRCLIASGMIAWWTFEFEGDGGNEHAFEKHVHWSDDHQLSAMEEGYFDDMDENSFDDVSCEDSYDYCDEVDEFSEEYISEDDDGSWESQEAIYENNDEQFEEADSFTDVPAQRDQVKASLRRTSNSSTDDKPQVARKSGIVATRKSPPELLGEVPVPAAPKKSVVAPAKTRRKPPLAPKTSKSTTLATATPSTVPTTQMKRAAPTAPTAPTAAAAPVARATTQLDKQKKGAVRLPSAKSGSSSASKEKLEMLRNMEAWMEGAATDKSIESSNGKANVPRKQDSLSMRPASKPVDLALLAISSQSTKAKPRSSMAL